MVNITRDSTKPLYPFTLLAQVVTNKCRPARVLDNEESETSARKDGRWIARDLFMRTAYTHATTLPVPTLPVGIDPHYETEHRLVWNDERSTNEEHIFVYEISWIPELGVCRWFCAHAA
jgi:hypothetical protein